MAGSNKGVIEHPVLKPLVKTYIPSPKSVNGSLINIAFNNLLSAVADSVDHIAAIQLVANLENRGALGTDKNPPPGIDPTTFKGYIGATARRSPSREVGGALIDGAIVGKQFRDGTGRIFFPSGHEYQPT